MFYDKSCSIYSREIVLENDREIAKDTLLYEDIDCDFFEERNIFKLEQGEVAKEEESWLMTVMLDGACPGIMIWQKVELKDTEGRSLWMFQIVRNPDMYLLPSGQVESIRLVVKKSHNGSQE